MIEKLRVIENIGANIRGLMDKSKMIEKYYDKLMEIESEGLGRVYLSEDYSCHVTVTSIGDVHNVRWKLREIFGGWSDKLNHTWYSCGMAIASWKGIGVAECEKFDIWLETSIESFPAELLPTEGCKWEKVQEDSFRVVCPIDGGE